MCGGKVGDAFDSATESLSQIDPTTEEGLLNVATGGLYGVANNLLGGSSSSSGETEAERSAAEVALAQYNLSQDLEFVRDEYKDQVDSLGSDAKKGAVTGVANVAAQSEVADAKQNALAGIQARGIDPTSGAGLATLNDVNESAGDAIGSAQGESAFALDTIALNQQENVIAQATGESTEAVAGLGDIASNAQALAAQKAQSEFNSKAQTASAIGTAVGGVGTYYKKAEGNT